MKSRPAHQRVLCTLGVLIALSVSLSACGRALKYLELAKEATVQFHSEFNQQQYSTIYRLSDASLRQTTSEPGFTAFLERVHQRLGIVTDPVLKSERISFHPGGGATVTLVYSTKFERGSGTERVIWNLEGDRVALSRYIIDSKTLLATSGQ